LTGTVFGLKLSLKEIRRIFTTKKRNFKLWKMPKLLNLGISQIGKRSSKLNVSVSERHRWAVVG